MKRFHLFYFAILIAASSLTISSCGIWTDFTTYFNLYYNTKDLFEQAETEIYSQKRELFSTSELIVPGTANQKLIKVIEKCSKILQHHSNSSYVDNALLIIGKSFYYQRNYQKALRKFQELLITGPDESMLLETNLWIAKTQMRLKDYEKGFESLKAVREKAFEEGEDQIVEQTYVEEIVFRISQEQYQDAIALTKEFLKISDNDVINAEAMNELGKLYLKVDNLNEAIIAFRKVFDYSPEYEVEYAAQMELARTLRMDNKTEESLDLFRSLRREDKHRDAFDQIDLEIGKTLIDLGEYEEALNTLIYVDTSYTNKVSSGAARYFLGEIYQYNEVNFDSAAAYYERAQRPPSPPEYMQLARNKSLLFSRYNNLRTQIDLNRKQLFYVQNPEEFVKDSLKFIEDSIALATEKMWEQFGESGFPGDDQQDTTGQTQRIIDSLLTIGASPDSFFAAQEKLKESESGVTGEFRRTRGGSTGQQEQKSVQELLGIKDPNEKKISPPRRPSQPEDTLKVVLARMYLDLGNLFLTEFEIYDSAYIYYDIVLSELRGNRYEGATLYSLANYYDLTGDIEKADSIFNYIYDNFKNESIVNAAATKINKPKIDLNKDPAADLYILAEEKMLENNYSASINEFLKIYRTYPKSSYAPKALFATGFILENYLQKYDSAASVYDSVLTMYPQTQYASVVLQKVITYRSDREKRKQAVQDSLNALKLKVDSLAVADSLKKLQQLEGVFAPVDSSTIIRNNIQQQNKQNEQQKIEEEKIDEESGMESDSGEENATYLRKDNLYKLLAVNHKYYIKIF